MCGLSASTPVINLKKEALLRMCELVLPNLTVGIAIE
jgi:hypothetical protein